MNQPIQVKTVADEYRHLDAERCRCGGRWRMDRQSVQRLPAHVLLDRLEVTCHACGATRTFVFELHKLDPAYRRELAASAVRESMEELELFGPAAAAAVQVCAESVDEALKRRCACGAAVELGHVELGPDGLHHLGVSCPTCGAVQALMYRIAEGEAPGHAAGEPPPGSPPPLAPPSPSAPPRRPALSAALDAIRADLESNAPGRARARLERVLAEGVDVAEVWFLHALSLIDQFDLVDGGPFRTPRTYDAACASLARAMQAGHVEAGLHHAGLSAYPREGLEPLGNATRLYLSSRRPNRGPDAPPGPARALLVGGAYHIHRALWRELRNTGWEVAWQEHVGTPEEVVAGPEPLDLLFVDDLMPLEEALRLIAVVRRLRPDLPIIFLSSGNYHLAWQAILAGATTYASKPFEDGSLLHALGAALEPVRAR